MLYQCPSCAKIIEFSHPDTSIMQCSCGTVVNRKEGDVLVSKPYSLIHQSPDIIQPGSQGVWQGKPFSVLGRVRVWLEESVFNYWTILFTDGSLAYLGEGYGLYSVLRKIEVERDALIYVNSADIRDESMLLPAIYFLLEKKSIVRRWDIEGEVYLPECNDTFKLYDYSSREGKQITLFQFIPNFFVAFEAVYIDFEALALTNLREKNYGGKQIDCSNCRKSFTVKTYPYAQSAVCPHCSVFYSLNDDAFRALGDRNETDIGPDIQLGSSGKIKGIAYECIGFTLKEENNKYRSRWNEYVLYNQQEGYAFLSEYEGNWVYVREVGNTPVLPKANVTSFEFNKEPFQLYNSYNYSIINGHGEFPYNVFNSGQTVCREFISPPEMWIQEYNKKEGIVWFHGEHVTGKEVEKAFEMPSGLPPKSGIGAVEPRFFISPGKLAFVSFVGIVCLLLLHTLIGLQKKERLILDEDYFFADSTDRVTAVTRKFHLEKSRSNLEFAIHSAVDNDWFELDATLVNATTGTEYSMEKGVEYYHGYSEGEYWTEGSTHEKAYITYIPAGNYFLQLQGIRNAYGNNRPNDFHVTVTYDVANDRNLWWSIVFLALWPIVQYIRTNQNEKKRWFNSPFSPFTYED